MNIHTIQTVRSAKENPDNVQNADHHQLYHISTGRAHLPHIKSHEPNLSKYLIYSLVSRPIASVLRCQSADPPSLNSTYKFPLRPRITFRPLHGQQQSSISPLNAQMGQKPLRHVNSPCAVAVVVMKMFA